MVNLPSLCLGPKIKDVVAAEVYDLTMVYGQYNIIPIRHTERYYPLCLFHNYNILYVCVLIVHRHDN